MAKKSKPPFVVNHTSEVNITKSSNQFFKQFILTIVALVLVVIIKSLPNHKLWLDNQIAAYYKDYKIQKKKMDLETRWQERHGYEYYIPKYIKENINTKTDIFLIPPREYLKKKNIPVNWMDSRWMYYMTEAKINKIAWDDSKSIANATHTIFFDEKGQFGIVKLDNEQNRNYITSQFLQQ